MLRSLRCRREYYFSPHHTSRSERRLEVTYGVSFYGLIETVIANFNQRIFVHA